MRPYTYALIDPRCGTEFYIGKGRKRRAWQHERDVRRGKMCNQPKTARIAEIIAAGHNVEVRILGWYATDRQAAAAEKVEIALRGREALTNLNGGGAIGAVPKWERHRFALARGLYGAQRLIARLRPDAVERSTNPALARWVIEGLHKNARDAAAGLAALAAG